MAQREVQKANHTGRYWELLRSNEVGKMGIVLGGQDSPAQNPTQDITKEFF